jgi:hypothetical protein
MVCHVCVCTSSQVTCFAGDTFSQTCPVPGVYAMVSLPWPLSGQSERARDNEENAHVDESASFKARGNDGRSAFRCSLHTSRKEPANRRNTLARRSQQVARVLLNEAVGTRTFRQQRREYPIWGLSVKLDESWQLSAEPGAGMWGCHRLSTRRDAARCAHVEEVGTLPSPSVCTPGSTAQY